MPLRLSRWALLCLLGLLSACATPRPVVLLEPTSRNVTWLAGRAIVAKQSGPWRVAVAFDRQRDDLLAFRVEVVNQGEVPLEVSPHSLCYVVCYTESHCERPAPVIDPEQVLLGLQEARAEEKASAANARTAGAVFFMLEIAAGVAEASSGKSHRGAFHASQAVFDAEHASDESARHEQVAANLEAEALDWESGSLRRTTLTAGQGAAGAVFVRQNLEAKRVWIGLRAAGEAIWFPFDQWVRRSDWKPRP